MISILMPVKNTSAYLNECIDSIINQSYTEWELIAVDDHSDDESYEILQRYAKRHPRIYTYKNTGVGIIDALRLAYTNSQGEYITRMDSDDIMTPDKLLLLRNALNKKQQLAVGLVKYISDGALGEGYKKYADWLNTMTMNRSNFSEIYKECVIPSPCWMMHREDLNAVGAFDSDTYPEDYDLAFRMRHNGMTIQDVPEVIHLWRDHPSRASRNDPHYMDNQFIQLKVQHFLNSDYNAAQSLVVWGAGKKGKKIVKLLRGHHVGVHWICNNPKKIGTTIYDTELHHPDSLMSIVSAQIIIAIAQKNAERDIKSHLQNHNGMDVYYFC